VHQLVTGADLDALDTAWGELRAVGWPVPEDPESDEDIELDGQALIADCLNDEVGWLRRCAGWITQLDAGGSPSAVDLARVRAIIERITADIDELARARRVDEMDTAAIRSDRPAPRRGRAAEPDRGFGSSVPARRCLRRRPRSWNEPGMHGRPNATGAARSTSSQPPPITPFAHADHHAHGSVQP
jgi:hypothetical protein